MWGSKKNNSATLDLLMVAALWSLRFLFRPGLYYAHDSIYHFVRQFHYFHELMQGQFPVRMGTELAYNFGYPLFNFVYSLPYLIGSLGVLLGFGYGNTLKGLVVLFSLISLMFWYYWLRRYFTDLAALLGALVFWFLPYRFLSIFVTFQYGGIIASGFFPLLLLGLDVLLSSNKLTQSKKVMAMVLAITGLVGLVLSHLITLIIYAPFLLCFGLWKLKKITQAQLLSLMWVVIFSLGLTAFYWLPVMLELKFIQAGQAAIVDYAAHFPTLNQLIRASWGYGYSVPGPADGISFQVGYAQWLAFSMAMILGLVTFVNQRLRKIFSPHLALLIVGGVSFVIYLFLMQPISTLLWQYLPLLKSVQHPWRLLAGIGVSASLLTSVIADTKWGKPVAILLVIIAMINTRNYQRPMTLDYRSDSELSAKSENAQSGDVSWEFLPIWAKAPATYPENIIRQWSGEVKTVSANGSQLNVSNDQTQELVINKIYYPSWQIFDQQTRLATYADNDGMLAVSLAPGEHQLQIQLGQTPAAAWGNWITVVSFTGGIFIIIYQFKKPSPYFK
jgi:hypothetical protein